MLLLGSHTHTHRTAPQIGDWGGVNLGGYHEKAEKAVAQQFQKSAAEVDSNFVVNVGDNFYYCGVKSLSDPLFEQDFEQVFTADSVQNTWYTALGNHDYGYSVEAQVQYKSPTSKVSNRWHLPSRYYKERISMGSGQHLSLVFIDTNPCVNKYRSNDPSGWDPCSGKYGDCPGCKFHENIIAQNCTAQFEWFTQTMANMDKNDWVVVVGHHLAHEMDTEDFVSVLQKYGFDLYLNGHQHELNTYTVDGAGHYITSGAGCMVALPDKREEHASETHSHSYTWYQKVAGFTTHTFNANFTSLTTNFINYAGETVHTLEVNKRA